MAHYESIFIARQEISASQVDSLADTFAKIVEDQGGSVVKREYWGLRSLAFRIKKNRKGHYVMFGIDGPPTFVQELERQMRINENVLRYLTIRVDEAEAGPSAMMQSRSSGRGDDRGGRREVRGRFDEQRGEDSRGGEGRGGEGRGGDFRGRNDQSRFDRPEGRREDGQHARGPQTARASETDSEGDAS